MIGEIFKVGATVVIGVIFACYGVAVLLMIASIIRDLLKELFSED